MAKVCCTMRNVITIQECLLIINAKVMENRIQTMKLMMVISKTIKEMVKEY